MNLHKQVCTLEQAKRLNELGIQQSGFFSWYETVDRDDEPRLNLSDENGIMLGKQSFEMKHSAFTVSELGKMLPQKFNVSGSFGEAQLLITKYDKWYVHYVDKATETVPYAREKSDSLAESMAAMLIFLLEKNITSVTALDEIEQRLDANGINK